MPTIEEHQAAIRALLAPLVERDPELRSISRPSGSVVPRVLARDVTSPISLPPFDNSQMDGYAVRSSEVADGVSLAVGERIAAGSGIRPLPEGTAAPIMTGAPIPEGADAVIPIELAIPDHFQPEGTDAVVTFPGEVPAGTYVRERGSDVAEGELLLSAGALLGASQWGLLAASGVAEVPLVSRLRVLLISTGDELAKAGRPLEGGQIYDANGASMAVALAAAGAVVTDILVVSDDADRLRALLAERLDGVDLVLTTGGASRGAYEVVRDVFGPIGVGFVTVAMQPGGPQGLGAAKFGDRTIPVVAFPGNPVSALVSFEVFLRPILLWLHGLTGGRPSGRAPLAEAVDSPEAKHQLLRGSMNQAGQIELTVGTGSHLLHNYSASTLLVHIPVGVAHLDAGELVEVWSIDD